MPNGPLNQFTIIEFAGLGPCPLAGQLMADLGADVIVIDRALGKADTRDVNRRNKRSIALDLKREAGREVALKLVAGADALIEGFRPGVMEKLGLGPDVCHARNPALVFGRMTGWGQEGPLAAYAGHDLNYMSLTGALAAIGAADAPPVPPLNLVADYGGGSMFLVFGVLAALLERQGSGRGQVVDAAMVDGVPAMMGIFHSLLARGAWETRRGANLLDGGAPFYRCYETRDGKAISVAPIEPQFFAEMCKRAGLPQIEPKDQMDKSRWPQQTREFAAVFATKTRDEWVELFDGSDACVAPVLTFDEIEAHPHNAARGIYFREDGVMQASPAPRFSRTPAARPQPAHGKGADGDAVLAAFGFSGEEIADLQREGAVLSG